MLMVILILGDTLCSVMLMVTVIPAEQHASLGS